MVGELQPDILCLQEIKINEGTIPEIELPGYIKNFNSAERKRYSGTVILSKIQSKNINCEIHLDSLTEKNEGRIILVKYEVFLFSKCLCPKFWERTGAIKFQASGLGR
jgi:exodeoxyribonuclease-3